MKKLISVLLVAAIMIVAFGCSAANTPASATSPAASQSAAPASAAASATASNPASAAASGKPLKIEYFATSFAVEWMQEIQAAMEKLGKENNFTVLTGDANRDINKQLSQIDTAISQGVDGAVLFVVDEGSATAAVEKFTQAKIPVIGETLKLKDASGKNIAPYVELNATAVGEKCGTWVVDNYKSSNVDLSDLSKVGFIANTNSKYRSDLARIEGFKSTFLKAFNLSKDHLFTADCAAEAAASDNTEASFKQVSAILAANPNIKSWVIMGSVDSYAMGACRAVESAGLQDNTILVSSGGELAVKEWANGTAKCWRATCYYSAMDFAQAITDGLMKQLRQGVKAQDLYPEFKTQGQDYSAVEISGNMCTASDYKQYVK
jgi:L-arabinose transport system substrate-binding protein